MRGEGGETVTNQEEGRLNSKFVTKEINLEVISRQKRHFH